MKRYANNHNQIHSYLIINHLPLLHDDHYYSNNMTKHYYFINILTPHYCRPSYYQPFLPPLLLLFLLAPTDNSPIISI